MIEIIISFIKYIRLFGKNISNIIIIFNYIYVTS